MKKNILTFILTTLVVHSFAQTNTWNGNTDTDWHKACNWSLNAVPTCSHDVVIPTGTANKPVITAVAHANTIEVQGSISSTLTISGSGTLDLTICSGTPTNNGGCCPPQPAPVWQNFCASVGSPGNGCTFPYGVIAAGAVSYTWTVIGGSIISGQGTANVQLRTDNGATNMYVTVVAISACGSSSTVTDLNVPVVYSPGCDCS